MTIETGRAIGDDADREAPPRDGDLLVRIHGNSVQTLELLRNLVRLLLPQTEPRSGPTLEELLAALVAMQRDQMALLRDILSGVETLRARFPENDDDEAVPPAADGRHHA